MIKYFGYPVEIHYVTAEDGYILEVHRIPHGLKNTIENTTTPVYLQHGIFISSAEFIYQTPERGLG